MTNIEQCGSFINTRFHIKWRSRIDLAPFFKRVQYNSRVDSHRWEIFIYPGKFTFKG